MLWWPAEGDCAGCLASSNAVHRWLGAVRLGGKWALARFGTRSKGPATRVGGNLCSTNSLVHNHAWYCLLMSMYVGDDDEFARVCSKNMNEYRVGWKIVLSEGHGVEGSVGLLANFPILGDFIECFCHSIKVTSYCINSWHSFHLSFL